MSDKKTNPHLCIVCGICGTKDDFTPESNNTCKQCLRVIQLEQRVRYLEERNLESAMKNMEIRMSALEKTMEIRMSALEKTMEIRMSALEKTMEIRMSALKETMEIRMSALEEINRQKNDDDLLDRQDAVQGKELRSPEQLKEEQEPVAESVAMAVGGRVPKQIAPGPLNKTELEEKLNAVIEENLYFVIGVAQRNGLSAKESMEKFEQRSPNLDEKNIQAIGDYKVNLVKVLYGKILKLCASESQRLLDIFRRDACKHCLNAKSGEDEWLREKDAEEGIVFLHVYSK